MSRVSRVYTQEFKEDAIRLLERTGRSYTQVSSDLGVSYCMFSQLVQRASYGKALEESPCGEGGGSPSSR